MSEEEVMAREPPQGLIVRSVMDAQLQSLERRLS